MHYKYRVSVLIPCYNGSQFIDRSFNSILQQTEKKIEIIFVDDGSNDCSLTVAKKYIGKFNAIESQLRIIQKPNGGAASAIKVALDMSTGKYILPLDVDDELLADSCKIQADYLDSNTDCGLVLTNGYKVFDDGQEIQLVRANGQLQNKNHIFRGLLSGVINNVPGMYMVRGDILRNYYSNHSFLITNYGQNLQLLMPSSYSHKAGYVNVPLLKYYVHKGSHSNPGLYDKEIANLKGYLDIRICMLEGMNLSTKEYFELAHQSFYEAALIVDAKYKRRKEYNFHYKAIKEYRNPSFQEKMEYSILNRSLWQYYYRFCSKFRIIWKRGTRLSY